ncbi:unnamed protein product [Mucor hiemalis]
MTAANLNLIEVYTKDIKAWFTDEEQGWVSASVLSKEQDDKSVKITFQDDQMQRSNTYLKPLWLILNQTKSVYHH